MLEYHAAYHEIEDGWYLAKVLDFPGAVSQGRTLRSARRMLRDSLEGLAEYILEKGKALPKPNPKAKEKSAVLEEKIILYVECRIPKRHETTKSSTTSSAARVRR